MNALEGGAPRPLASRIKGILTDPHGEWALIEAEPTSRLELYRRYILILAAIGPIAALIGALVIGYSMGGVTFRPAPLRALWAAVVGYGLNVGAVWVLAMVVNGLAPLFNCRPDPAQALKVVAYSATPGWIIGIVGLYPPLAPLMVLGLYGVYLLYLGLPILMKAPQSAGGGYKIGGYLTAILFAGLVIGAAITGVTYATARAGLVPSPGATLSYKGQSVDVGKAKKVVEQAVAATQSGAPPKASGEELQTLLPEALASGFKRHTVSNDSRNLAGYALVEAKGLYSRGPDSLEIEINDVGPAGGLAGALSVKSSKETPDGYEKIGSEQGRPIFESYNRVSHSGKFSTLIGERFMVEASGKGVTIEDLRAAVQAVDLARLEAFARS